VRYITPKDVVSLFPIPVAIVPLSGDFSKEIQTLKTLDMRRTDDNSPQSHDVSTNSYCLQLDTVSRLTAYIEAVASEYMREVMSFSLPAKVTQSWVNRNNKGEPTHQHTHGNSIVSGVFYMDIPGGEGVIRFHKNQSSGNGRTYYMDPAIDTTKQNLFTYDWVDITVNPGDILLFPSYLTHSVPAHQDTAPRWSLAFNSVPKGGLGLEHNLTELIID